MTSPPLLPELTWRQDNLGRLLNQAVRRFETRVLELLAAQELPRLAPSHINATRHLDLDGTRLTELAQRAAMTKQSMSELVTQLERLGLVARHPDPSDTRARIIRFTPLGLEWLQAFGNAVTQAEQEFAALSGSGLLSTFKATLQTYADEPLPPGELSPVGSGADDEESSGKPA